jgi:hypothetical protein
MARVLTGKPTQRVQSEQSPKLSTRKGIVYGSLRREDIYDEYLTRKTSLSSIGSSIKTRAKGPMTEDQTLCIP